MNSPARPIHVFALLFVVCGLAATTVPRLIARQQSGEGLAGAATVGAVFLLFAVAAAILAIVTFVITWRRRAAISTAAKLIGFFPLPIVLAAVVFLWTLVQKQRRNAEENSLPSQTHVPTAVPSEP